MEDKTDIKQKWDIIFAVLLIIGLLVVSYIKKYRNINIAEENLKNESTVPAYISPTPAPNAEPKDVFHQDIHAYMDEKLYSLGFVDDTSDRCRYFEKCFKKDNYFITYNTMSTLLNIYVDGTKDNIKNHNYTKDFELLDEMYNRKINISDNIKKLINDFDRFNFHNINIETDNMYVRIAYYYDGLEYTISPRYISEEKTIFKPISLDTIISSLKDNDKTNFMKRLYDISMENNKQYFKYNDYFYVALKNTSKDLCSVGYIEGNYSFSSSFCHGGTSDAYYRFNYSKSKSEYDQIILNYKGNYFSDYYLNIIKNDLEYFSKKLNTKLSLSKENTSLIKDFMNKESHNETIIISPKLSIDLEMTNYSVRNYNITYKIYK